ncbi:MULTISPECIES: hypothetical protein [unclassified Bradyrhizobium]|uniref:hypothetical protein n=1 Tax=Bradyrhizobium TaxID=374 RepID=UPI0028EABD69|nr:MULTISPECIES: hypothetical protein [unclassified Bradyrhizobium]
MADRDPAEMRKKVDLALKSVVDSEIARASLKIDIMAEGVPFSRGAIFSKTNPFSRGIVFSRLAAMERPDEMEREIANDPAVLGALAERLTQVRAVKDLKGQFSVPQAGGAPKSVR